MEKMHLNIEETPLLTHLTKHRPKPRRNNTQRPRNKTLRPTNKAHQSECNFSIQENIYNRDKLKTNGEKKYRGILQNNVARRIVSLQSNSNQKVEKSRQLLFPTAMSQRPVNSLVKQQHCNGAKAAFLRQPVTKNQKITHQLANTNNNSNVNKKLNNFTANKINDHLNVNENTAVKHNFNHKHKFTVDKYSKHSRNSTANKNSSDNQKPTLNCNDNRNYSVDENFTNNENNSYDIHNSLAKRNFNDNRNSIINKNYSNTQNHLLKQNSNDKPTYTVNAVNKNLAEKENTNIKENTNNLTNTLQSNFSDNQNSLVNNRKSSENKNSIFRRNSFQKKTSNDYLSSTIKENLDVSLSFAVNDNSSQSPIVYKSYNESEKSMVNKSYIESENSTLNLRYIESENSTVNQRYNESENTTVNQRYNESENSMVKRNSELAIPMYSSNKAEPGENSPKNNIQDTTKSCFKSSKLITSSLENLMDTMFSHDAINFSSEEENDIYDFDIDNTSPIIRDEPLVKPHFKLEDGSQKTTIKPNEFGGRKIQQDTKIAAQSKTPVFRKKKEAYLQHAKAQLIKELNNKINKATNDTTKAKIPSTASTDFYRQRLSGSRKNSVEDEFTSRQDDPDELTNQMIAKDLNEKMNEIKVRKTNMTKRMLRQLSFRNSSVNKNKQILKPNDKSVKSYLPDNKAELLMFKERDNTSKERDNTSKERGSDSKERDDNSNDPDNEYEPTKSPSKLFLRNSFRKLSNSMTSLRGNFKTRSLSNLSDFQKSTNSLNSCENVQFDDPDEVTNQMLSVYLTHDTKTKPSATSENNEVKNSHLSHQKQTNHDLIQEQKSFNNHVSCNNKEGNNQPTLYSHKPHVITTHNDISGRSVKNKNSYAGNNYNHLGKLTTKSGSEHKKNRYEIHNTSLSANRDIINEIVKKSDMALSRNANSFSSDNKFENNIRMLRKNIEQLNDLTKIDKSNEKTKLNDVNTLSQTYTDSKQYKNNLVNKNTEKINNDYIKRDNSLNVKEEINSKKKDSLKHFLMNKFYNKKNTTQIVLDQNSIDQANNHRKSIDLNSLDNKDNPMNFKTDFIGTNKLGFFTPTSVRKSYQISTYTPNPVRRRVYLDGRLISKEERAKNNLIRSLSITMSKNNLQF